MRDLITIGLKKMLAKAQAGEFQDARHVIELLRKRDLPNFMAETLSAPLEQQKAHVLSGLLSKIDVALHLEQIENSADLIREAIAEWG